MSQKNVIHCPICGNATEFSAKPVGPFCSVRCQMVDLGKWLNEEYRVSEPLKPQHFEEYEELYGDHLDLPDHR